MSGRRMIATCDEHAAPIDNYVASHVDAEIRMGRGERQVRCRECGLWVWPRGAA